MNKQLLLQNAEQYVRDFFATKVDKIFRFHCIRHTEGVVEAATAMADYYQLSEEDSTALLLAAWFHDTGYSKGQSSNHESESQKIVIRFLENKDITETARQKVIACIAATKVPQAPSNLLEMIICDADLHHLGTDNFVEENKLLRRELNDSNSEDLSKKEWRKINIEFLQKHQYFTDYATTHFEPLKQEHLRVLQEKEAVKLDKKMYKSKKFDVTNSSAKLNNPISSAEINQSKLTQTSTVNEKEKSTDTKADRSIGTMFRIMSENHVSLSQMADSKANIMISVNTIVLSIIVSVLFSKLQYYPQFIIPTILLCSVSMTAIIFAILSTRPNVNKGTFYPEDIKKKKVNLLFFGNFFKMQLPDYEWAMKEMMNDKEYLYGSMIKDIYYLGNVLAKKYKFLRMSYNIFMFGLVISMLAFVIAFVVKSD